MTIAAACGAREHLDAAAYEATRLEHAPLLKFLASCGATLSSYNTPADSPLFSAKNSEIMYHLLHSFSLNSKIRDRFGATALHWAMASDRESGCAEKLLAASTDIVNASDFDGWNALHCLALMRHEDIGSFAEKLKLIYNGGGDLNALTSNNETPMSILYRHSESPLPIKKEGLKWMKNLGANSCPEDVESIKRFLCENSLN